MSETAARLLAAQARFKAAQGELAYAQNPVPAPSRLPADPAIRVTGNGPRSAHQMPQAGDVTIDGGRPDVEYVYSRAEIRALQNAGHQAMFMEFSSPGGYARDVAIHDVSSGRGDRYYFHFDGVVVTGHAFAHDNTVAAFARTVIYKALVCLKARRCPFLDITGVMADPDHFREVQGQGLPLVAVIAGYLQFLRRRARSSLVAWQPRQHVPQPRMKVRAGHRVLSPAMVRDLQEVGSFNLWGANGEKYPTPPTTPAKKPQPRKRGRTRKQRKKAQQAQEQQVVRT
jgi:hypothetical protein